VSMTGKTNRAVKLRRRWSVEEKMRIVHETYAPGMSVSLVARQHGIAAKQVFAWRRLYLDSARSTIRGGEDPVPASEYRALQQLVDELQRLLGKKTVENAILREALDLMQEKELQSRSPSRPPDDIR
jgi:transposase